MGAVTEERCRVYDKDSKRNCALIIEQALSNQNIRVSQRQNVHDRLDYCGHPVDGEEGPAEKGHRHYKEISICSGVLMGF